jgi:hypothetical protein
MMDLECTQKVGFCSIAAIFAGRGIGASREVGASCAPVLGRALLDGVELPLVRELQRNVRLATAAMKLAARGASQHQHSDRTT